MVRIRSLEPSSTCSCFVFTRLPSTCFPMKVPRLADALTLPFCDWDTKSKYVGLPQKSHLTHMTCLNLSFSCVHMLHTLRSTSNAPDGQRHVSSLASTTTTAIITPMPCMALLKASLIFPQKFKVLNTLVSSRHSSLRDVQRNTQNFSIGSWKHKFIDTVRLGASHAGKKP